MYRFIHSAPDADTGWQDWVLYESTRTSFFNTVTAFLVHRGLLLIQHCFGAPHLVVLNHS